MKRQPKVRPCTYQITTTPGNDQDGYVALTLRHNLSTNKGGGPVLVVSETIILPIPGRFYSVGERGVSEWFWMRFSVFHSLIIDFTIVYLVSIQFL